MNKIAKKYNNMKKNLNKNNIYIQKGKKITKKKSNIVFYTKNRLY